ncbi:MAG: hypothetical protein JWN35_3609 [Frankiales bacterium]|nr:hypothetical protein [Frankiales bacterium]
MNAPDMMPGAEPADVAALVRDDALVESLRGALVPGGSSAPFEDAADPAYALLLALQLDVVADLPVSDGALPEVPATVGRRRSFGRGATVAVVTAGLLSVAGAAAAATSSPGDPLYGVRVVVGDVVTAVGDVVAAIAPAHPAKPSRAASPTDRPSSSAPSPALSPQQSTGVPSRLGATGAGSTRPMPAAPVAHSTPAGNADSARAAGLVEVRLGRATKLMDARRYDAARAELAQAKHDLTAVTEPGPHASLQDRLTRLERRLAAESAPAAQPVPAEPTAEHTGTRPVPEATGDDNGSRDVGNRNSGRSGDDNHDSGHNGNARQDRSGGVSVPASSGPVQHDRTEDRGTRDRRTGEDSAPASGQNRSGQSWGRPGQSGQSTSGGTVSSDAVSSDATSAVTSAGGTPAGQDTSGDRGSADTGSSGGRGGRGERPGWGGSGR